ncbi:MAG: hypothetical protein P4L49_20095 [Desulfosporosinus sp.]|nr:hypothetical protein [Desulfosporosinus sp.]
MKCGLSGDQVLSVGDTSGWGKGEIALRETEGTQWENLLDLSLNIDSLAS